MVGSCDGRGSGIEIEGPADGTSDGTSEPKAWKAGDTEGVDDGGLEGANDGTLDGASEPKPAKTGGTDGIEDGASEKPAEGLPEGTTDGPSDPRSSQTVGLCDGTADGVSDGMVLGASDIVEIGDPDGLATESVSVGDALGTSDGSSEESGPKVGMSRMLNGDTVVGHGTGTSDG
jgi:hypothetical protein